MSSSPDADMVMNGTGDDGDSVTVRSQGQDGTNNTTYPPNNADVPKPKRLACMICRKRKLRCDGNRPRCATCTRLGHDCAYDEVRRKSGPKRGYVKALEERLKQVETLLKTQDSPVPLQPVANNGPSITVSPDARISNNTPPMPNISVPDHSLGLAASGDAENWDFVGDNSPQPQQTGPDTFDFNAIPMQNNFPWEMIGLGLEEPLPAQESIDEFHQIYFEKIHPSTPMIHKYRYLAAMNLAPAQRPPVCLRYAIWTLACSVVEKYSGLRDLFYQRARRYVESDYTKGFGEHLISVAHAQTHVLLAQYEFKMMYFPRAWMSTGSAVRLCQMMGLHRLDGVGLDVKMCIPPPKDWTEKEERRRTFWMAFNEDRYASIGTGWPMTIDEKDIMTDLPASDDAFDMSRPEPSQTLAESMTPAGAGIISSTGGVSLMACLFGRNLLHLHRPDVDDRDHDLNGEFWKRHRNLDNILLNTSLCLPAHIKLPGGLSNPNVIFTNMCIHTSTICLHQAAIFKADKNRLPSSVSAESKVRCITAANEIASIMRLISHMDLATVNPFTSFSLYVAARVFVQYLKSRPDESQVADSLRFLLAAMGALKKRNPLTESFLVQLDVDLEALGTRIPKLRNVFHRSTNGVFSRIIPGMDNTTMRPGGHRHVPMATLESERGCFAVCDLSDSSGKTPDTIDIDPSLTNNNPNPNNVPQNPIPAFSGMDNGRWPKDKGGASILDRMRQDPHNSKFFGSSLLQDMINGDSMADMSLSPDVGSGGGGGGASTASDRLTPNSSTTPASDRQRTNSGSGGGDVSRGGGAAQQRGMFDGEMPTGLTPGRQFGGGAPETPKDAAADGGAGAGAGEFSWENFGAGSGMTPMSEGVLRTIMQMEPMETMDLGWGDAPGV